jgi:ketosteroid isomerase-like protein
MSIKGNIEVVRQFQKALAEGERDMSRFFQDDVEWHLPPSSPIYGTLIGREAVCALFSGDIDNWYQSGTISYDYHRPIADDDNVVTPFTMRAVTANGLDYENEYCMWFRLKDGLIAEVHEYFDTSRLYELIKPE